MFRQKERILLMVILAAGGQASASECVVSPIRSIITIGSEP